MTTGFIIRRLRQVQGVSQEELAAKLGVTRTYLCMVENEKKKASLSFLRAVAAFFRIPVSLLVGWEGFSDPDDQILQEVKRLFTDLLQARLAVSPEGVQVSD